jgi:hypothetical protein
VKEKGDIAELAGNSLDNIILYQFPTFLSRYLTASRSHFLEKKCYKGKRKQGSKSGWSEREQGKELRVRGKSDASWPWPGRSLTCWRDLRKLV